MNKNLITVAISDAIAQRFGVQPGERQISAYLGDAESGVAFMISQIAYLEQQIYEVKYADIVFDQLVPMETNIPEGAASVAYRSYDGATIGKFLGARADDIPLVAAEAQVHTVQLGYSGIGTKYSLDEARTAALAGMPLDAAQARIAYRGARMHQQNVVLFGDASRGMYGLLNHPNVTKTNSTVDWATADIDAIVGEINDAISTVWVNSKQRFLPNTLLIDGARYAKLVNRKISEAGNVSALKYLMENNLYKVQTNKDLEIRPIPHVAADVLAANGVSNGGKARMVAYEKHIDNLKAYMPIPPRFVAPQLINLHIITPMEYKNSGTEFIYPTSAIYIDAM